MRRFKDLAFQDVRLKKTTTGLETHLLSRQTLVSFFWTFGNYNCPRKKKCCCCRSKFRFSVPDGHFCRKWKEVFWQLTKANENSLQQFLQLSGRKKTKNFSNFETWFTDRRRFLLPLFLFSSLWVQVPTKTSFHNFPEKHASDRAKSAEKTSEMCRKKAIANTGGEEKTYKRFFWGKRASCAINSRSGARSTAKDKRSQTRTSISNKFLLWNRHIYVAINN